jgi:hypothetical protein
MSIQMVALLKKQTNKGIPQFYNCWMLNFFLVADFYADLDAGYNGCKFSLLSFCLLGQNKKKNVLFPVTGPTLTMFFLLEES